MSRLTKKPCVACDLIGLDSKGNPQPPGHPSIVGYAYREPPRHRGRARRIPLVPLPKGMDAPWRKLL